MVAVRSHRKARHRLKQKLEVIYILPSRYDDDGYVMRFWRGVVPSNTLCCLKGLTEDLIQQGELGDAVDASVTIYDDGVQRPPIRRLIRRNRRRGTRVLVGLVGVQSNQFARASDLALELRAGGVPVMIGGFHVSGMLAMFDEPSYELQKVLEHGVTLVRGEAEAPGLLKQILRDALAGEMQPIYQVTEPPDISRAALPHADPKYLKRFVTKTMATLDTSRGCPYNCSFCTIINVQGKTMRCRSAAPILKSIRDNYMPGRFYFFTDDNLSRSAVWEPLFDGLTVMRLRGLDISFMMQIDTQAWRIPGFVERAQKAGCRIVFIGMESVNPKNLEAAGKTQNDTEQYARMVSTWHDAGVMVHVGYIIGFPYDTPESVRQDIEVLRDRIKVDEASFFMLTPLPGSQDHKDLVEKGIPIDADPNTYDSARETFRHARFKPGEWQAAYDEAWEAFYSKESIVNILLRAPRHEYWYMFWIMVWYRYSGVFARNHPMAAGLFRFKDRKSRRPTFPRESVWRYAYRRVSDFVWGAKTYIRLFFEFQEIWMLSRKPDDPRWATLADMHVRWTRMQQRISESDLRGRCDLAAQEVRAMLASTAERLSELSRTRKRIGAPLRRRLRRKSNEIEAYLRSFDIQAPTRATVARAQRYVAEGLVAGYEELAIRYVAKRRRLNAYRNELMLRLKTGRILTMRVSHMVRLVVYEVLLALRFWFTALKQGV